MVDKRAINRNKAQAFDLTLRKQKPVKGSRVSGSGSTAIKVWCSLIEMSSIPMLVSRRGNVLRPGVS
jgi:hypothetical protein